jgi:hypothetical protein
VVTNTDDWSNIPYYPTNKEKRQQAADNFIKNGKQVPFTLLKQIQRDQIDTIKNDAFNVNNFNVDNNLVRSNENRQYSKKNIPIKQQQPPNKYSPQYANYIKAPSRATASASARIRLGGVY